MTLTFGIDLTYKLGRQGSHETCEGRPRLPGLPSFTED